MHQHLEHAWDMKAIVTQKAGASVVDNGDYHVELIYLLSLLRRAYQLREPKSYCKLAKKACIVSLLLH